MAAGVPPVLGLCASAMVFTVGAQQSRTAPRFGEFSLPRTLAGYSQLTGSVSAAPPGPAVALFQHGFGVEFLDFPQAVVLGAGGDSYRRVDVAEDRAGPETQGDPAPMLLSPDGRYVAVGDHDTDEPDVVVVDLTSGDATTYALPRGRSVIPVAWSSDGQRLATLLSPAPTNPYSGGRITGEVGLLDLSSEKTSVVPGGDSATAVAFSSDGSSLSVERTAGGRTAISVVTDEVTRDVAADGLLSGPSAWSPDGRWVAITTVMPSGAPTEADDPGIPTGLAFVDVTGAGAEAPEPLLLPLAGPGRVLGWDGTDAVVVLLKADGDSAAYTVSRVPVDGSEPTTLMRIGDLDAYGVGRFQLAADAAVGLQVVNPDKVDRGPWPTPIRVGTSVVAGLVVWLAAWPVLRVAGRRTSSRSRS